MGGLCGRQMSGYQRDAIMIDVQQKLNSITGAVQGVTSTCNGLDTRLYYIRESTFQSLQVLKTGLEQVHNEVLAIKAQKRQSQRLDYLDLCTYDAYELPRNARMQFSRSAKPKRIEENPYEDVEGASKNPRKADVRDHPKLGVGARPKIKTNLQTSLQTRKDYLQMK